MKKNIFWIFSILLLFLVIQPVVAQTVYNVGTYTFIIKNGNYYRISGSDTIPLTIDKVLIKLNSDVSDNEKNTFASNLGLTHFKTSKLGISLFLVNAGTDFLNLVPNLSNDIRVEYFDLNYLITYSSWNPIPPTNDSYQIIWDEMFTNPKFMWPYENTQLYDAWQVTTGNPEIVVGMIDNGIFLEHEDINAGQDSYSNIWYNMSEIPANGLDDDSNGYIDDYYGWNFGVINNQYGNNDVSHLRPSEYPHGTTTSGIIAGKTNNEVGVFGIAGGWNGPGVRVMTVKTSKLYFNGQFWEDRVETAQLPFAIEYAIDNGARILNMPWGISENINSLEDIFYEESLSGRTMFLAATGNADSEDAVAYPARSEYVIAVGATEMAADEVRWSGKDPGNNWGSNYGDEVEIAAPGSPLKAIVGGTIGQYYSDYIFNTSGEPDYCGTSYSVSFASGVVALMLSVDACLTFDEIREILHNTADKITGVQIPYYDYNHDANRPGHSRELGYGRINARAAVEACIPYPDQNITSNVTWNTYMRIGGNVTVEDGGELTIGSDAIIKFHPYNKILVKKGGRLIVDGGTIATGCSDFWEGIEVHGDPTLPQVPSSNQGYVQVKNNGKIENALCALRLFSPDEYRSGEDMPLTGNDGGGIAKCLDSRFINNKLALDIRYYPNINNQSTFNNCLFEINDDYLKKNKDQYGNYTTPKFDLMANLVFVNGIDFNACKFKVKDYESWDYPYYGKAINSINSNFNVKPLCIMSPCEDNPPYISTFSGFDYAIYAVNTANLSNFSVEQSEFLNNYSCIYANSVPFAKVLKNKINIELSTLEPEAQNRAASGLYIDNCTAYHIEGNLFKGESTNLNSKNVGAYIKDSGPSTNYVYNNTFQRLTFGSIAEGYNCNDDDGLRGTGLCYKCNDFSDIHTDIYVTKSGKAVPYGIRAYQGFPSLSDTSAAGNVFSQLPSNSMNIINEGKHEIQYFYHQNAIGVQPEYLIPIRKSFVTNHRNNYTTYYKSVSCATWINKDIPPIESLMSDYISNLNLELESKQSIEVLKDGGDTQTTIETIEYSYPDEAFVLRDDLLSKSPYLSDTTLKSAIEKETVLNNALLRDVLVSNPQAARSEEMLIKLDERTYLMPDAMYLEVLESADNYSPYNLLMEDYALANHNKSLAFNSIVETILSDTLIESGCPQLENLVNLNGTINSELVLINYYLNKSMFSSAYSRIQGLNTRLPGVPSIPVIQMQLNSLFNILKPAVSDTLFILDTTSSHILIALSHQAEYPVNIWANNLLNSLSVNFPAELYVFPGEYKSNKVRIRPVPDTFYSSDSDTRLRIYPNPANTHFVARYKVPEGSIEKTLQIRSLDGRILVSYKLSGIENQKVINIENLSGAMYLVELYADGILISSEKVSIVK